MRDEPLRRYNHTDRTRPIVRFRFECTDTCHKGTDDAREFERHLADCPMIFPAVASLIRRKLKAGGSVVVEREMAKERPGQIDAFPEILSRKRR